MNLFAVGRVLAKLTAWLLGGLLALAAVWYAANRTLDPRINDSLVAARQVPDDQNAAVALLGLTAPSGTDFREYGHKVDALYDTDAPQDRILDALKGEKTLQPTVESEQANCWLDPDWPALEGCPPFEKGAEAVHANKELIDRLRQVFPLKRYAGSGAYFNQAVFTVLKLSVADMQLDIRRGAREAAYRKWRDQFMFVRVMVKGTDTWVGRTVGIIAMGVTLPVLENLLNADPDIARRHESELLDLLRPGGIAAFGPDGIARGEYTLLKRWLARRGRDEAASSNDRLGWLVERFGQKNRILNRYARFTSEYARAMQAPWKDLAAEYQRLREKYYEPTAWEFILDPFGSVFIAEHIDSQLRIREMIRQMHVLDGRLRLATLLVRQINESVGDVEITRFLGRAGPELRDPFSGQPMQWDPKDRKIYMTDPDERCRVIAWLRLPAPRATPRPSGSTVTTNAC